MLRMWEGQSSLHCSDREIEQGRFSNEITLVRPDNFNDKSRVCVYTSHDRI
jgi:hypothetical protein